MRDMVTVRFKSDLVEGWLEQEKPRQVAENFVALYDGEAEIIEE